MTSLDQLFQLFARAQGGNLMDDYYQPHEVEPVDSFFQSEDEAFSTAQEIARILGADGLIPPLILVPDHQNQEPYPQLQNYQYYDGSLPLCELFDPLRRKTYMDPRYQEFIDDYDRIFGNGTMKL